MSFFWFHCRALWGLSQTCTLSADDGRSWDVQNKSCQIIKVNVLTEFCVKLKFNRLVLVVENENKNQFDKRWWFCWMCLQVPFWKMTLIYVHISNGLPLQITRGNVTKKCLSQIIYSFSFRDWHEMLLKVWIKFRQMRIRLVRKSKPCLKAQQTPRRIKKDPIVFNFIFL